MEKKAETYEPVQNPCRQIEKDDSIPPPPDPDEQQREKRANRIWKWKKLVGDALNANDSRKKRNSLPTRNHQYLMMAVTSAIG